MSFYHFQWLESIFFQSINSPCVFLPVPPAGHGGSLNFTASSSSYCTLPPGGTLTLGAAHKLVHRAVEVLPDTALRGWITLFRLWRRVWSEEEVTSLGCVEGEMVMWWREDWDLDSCTPLSEPSLTCGESHREHLRFNRGDMQVSNTLSVWLAEWSFYEVNLLFAIFWSDGSSTKLEAAKEIVQQWVKNRKDC